MNHTLTLTDEADETVRQQIIGPLGDYNTSRAGPSQGRPLVVALRDAEGAVQGGLWGVTGYGWLFTQLLIVPADLRGRGIGGDILQQAEDEACRRGCQGAWLDTFEFQARGFYERKGYTCFGELPDYPTGFRRFFMKKVLVPADNTAVEQR